MKKRPLAIWCLTFLIIRGMLLLITSGETFVRIPASSIFSRQEEKLEVLIQGQVYQKKNTSKVQILYLKNNSIIRGNDSYYESNILIYDDTFENIPIGKTVSVRAKLYFFERPRNPGNFNEQLYYAKQDIFGFAWSDEIVSVSGTEKTISEKLYRFRNNWEDTILSHLSEENGRVLSAMLLGDKSGMDEEVKELYQKSGLSHLLAISGLHISFIGLGLYRLLRKIGLSYGSAGLLALVVLSLYVAMIGFSVSVFRAYLMLLLRIGADITGRVYDMFTALMLAAALIVLYQPLYLADAAFYLSHGAILGIIWILPIVKEGLCVKKKWLEGFWVSVSINLATFPILLWFYYEYAIYSVILNMVAIPLMSVILGTGVLGSLCAFGIPNLGGIFLKMCDVLLSLITSLGKLGTTLPMSRFVFGKPNWWEVLIYYVLLVGGILLAYRSAHKKRGSSKAVAAGLGVFVSIIAVMLMKFPSGSLWITMLDVGQGDCIFLQGPEGVTYLVDGGSSDVEQVGKYRIEPFLKHQGVGKLDYVFVSHGDLDHYNGIAQMLERQQFGIVIKTLVLPVHYKQDKKLLSLAMFAKQYGTDVAVIDAGEKITEGEMEFDCIQPSQDGKVLEGNAGSMVLSLSFGEFQMLFTGDTEGEGEKMLRQKLSKEGYDILKVSHHGSKSSSEEVFLQKVRPRIALISSGRNNSYGHPHSETLERLMKYHCQILKTTERGAIRLKTDGEFIDISPSSI